MDLLLSLLLLPLVLPELAALFNMPTPSCSTPIFLAFLFCPQADHTCNTLSMTPPSCRALHTLRPAPRCAHQAVVYKNFMYVFGGEITSPNQERFHHYKVCGWG